MSAPAVGAPLSRTIGWRDLAAPQPITAAAVNAYTIQPEILPIIFVPGVMGSRLMGPQGILWDPDDEATFCINFGLRYGGIRARVKALVGAQGYHPHHLWLARQDLRYQADGSWQNVVQSAYGTLAQSLKTVRWSRAMHLCFQMPVYAFAYNWTQSIDSLGLQLKDFIEQIKSRHQGEGMCQQVIVVSHSMGGLVARAAAMLHGAQQQILGMVHTVMPLAGAPVGYLRIKKGFEAPYVSGLSKAALLALGKNIATSLLLGSTSFRVAPVLGQMPGVLSLLPNHLYKDGEQQPGWITLASRPGAEPNDRLPQNADPYEEIYRAQRGQARLFEVPPSCTHGVVAACHEASCWQSVLGTMDDVEHAHRRLGAKCHPNSFHIVSRGLPTVDRAQFMMGKGADPVARLHDPGGGSLVDLCTGDGDGTVPLHSALTGIEDASTVSILEGVPHDAAMAHPQVLALVRQRIMDLTHGYIAQHLAKGA